MEAHFAVPHTDRPGTADTSAMKQVTAANLFEIALKTVLNP
jgi:hypothetical protein